MQKVETALISNQKAEKDKENKTINEKNKANSEFQKKVMIIQLSKI